jgi:spermidine/putrescine transport system substrate-binding protein
VVKPTSTPPVLARELVLYTWADYMPQAVLDTFEKEYSVKVIYRTYDSMEEGATSIMSGTVAYDVAVVENDLVTELAQNNLLADIDFHIVSNIKNTSPNFRDPAADPHNEHSVPYNFGTTGLLVRSDLIKTPVRHWADLWDEQYAGKTAVRPQPTELISVGLLSLGYPLNSEDPAQLQAVQDRLRILKKTTRFVEVGTEDAIQPLLDGQVLILLGWSGDASIARERNSAIQYVIPEEGTMLWGDSFVISAKSSNQYTAEVFLNFLLRPTIGAEIVQAYRYPTTNDAVRALLPASLANDPLVYPPSRLLTKDSFYKPLSPAGLKRYDETWKLAMGSE